MFKWTYSYDNLGNIETITDNVGNKTVGSYSYDVQNQLTQETYKYRRATVIRLCSSSTTRTGIRLP